MQHFGSPTATLVLCSLIVGTRGRQWAIQCCCRPPPPQHCDWEWLLTTGQTTSHVNEKPMAPAVRVSPSVTKILTAELIHPSLLSLFFISPSSLSRPVNGNIRECNRYCKWTWFTNNYPLLATKLSVRLCHTGSQEGLLAKDNVKTAIKRRGLQAQTLYKHWRS